MPKTIEVPRGSAVKTGTARPDWLLRERESVAAQTSVTMTNTGSMFIIGTFAGTNDADDLAWAQFVTSDAFAVTLAEARADVAQGRTEPMTLEDLD